jgi:transposase-like protein
MTYKATTEAPYKFGPDVRLQYLALLRAGHGRINAARSLGISPDTVRRYARASEEFRESVAEAEEEAAEPVEAKLYEAALAGEPWAVTKWLAARMRARWGEETRKVEVQHVLEAGPGMTAIAARVGALAAELEARRAALEEAGDVIDVTSHRVHREAPALVPVRPSIPES